VETGEIARFPWLIRIYVWILNFSHLQKAAKTSETRSAAKTLVISRPRLNDSLPMDLYIVVACNRLQNGARADISKSVFVYRAQLGTTLEICPNHKRCKCNRIARDILRVYERPHASVAHSFASIFCDRPIMGDEFNAFGANQKQYAERGFFVCQ
jgi:hypothetical protein